MELQYIKTMGCPHCSCNEIVEENVEHRDTKIKTHINGDRWENRRFLCGFGVGYIPNFREEREIYECKNTEEYKNKQLEKQIVKDHMDKRLQKLSKKYPEAVENYRSEHFIR